MPHKNDIKFVKTERRNDRTAWPYGVGDEGRAHCLFLRLKRMRDTKKRERKVNRKLTDTESIYDSTMEIKLGEKQFENSHENGREKRVSMMKEKKIGKILAREREREVFSDDFIQTRLPHFIVPARGRDRKPLEPSFEF